MGKTSSKSQAPKMPRKSAETMELGLAKLDSSGLTVEDAQQLGIQFLDPNETQSLHKNFKALRPRATKSTTSTTFACCLNLLSPIMATNLT